MSEPVSEYQWQESFRRISAVLPALTKKELDIIGDVATEFVKNSASDRDIRPLNEQELWARIDHSIEQADRGEVLTLEEKWSQLIRSLNYEGVQTCDHGGCKRGFEEIPLLYQEQIQ